MTWRTNTSVLPLVFVADDAAPVAASTARFIRSQGMRAEVFLSGADLLNSGRVGEADRLILDLRMPKYGSRTHRLKMPRAASKPSHYEIRV
jgi:FixJ family two-component response regulator